MYWINARKHVLITKKIVRNIIYTFMHIVEIVQLPVLFR